MSEALRRAAQQGRTDFVQRILDRGFDADAAEEEDGITPLMYAAEDGHVDTMLLLLDRGAKVDARSVAGVTALMVAAYGGHTAAIQLLIDQGADVNAKCEEGTTALHRAAYGGNTSTEIDLRQPAEPFSPHGYVDAIELLLRSGANINAADETGFTVLMMAMGLGDIGFVRVLLDAGADAMAVDGNGDTARDLAELNGHADIVELLSAARLK